MLRYDEIERGGGDARAAVAVAYDVLEGVLAGQ